MNSTRVVSVFRISRRLAWLTCAFALLTLLLNRSIWVWSVAILACITFLILSMLATGLESAKESWTRLLCLSWLEFPALAFLEPTVGKSTIQDYFAASLTRELPVTTVSFGDGEDVNSAYTKYGAQFIKEKMGLGNEED